MQLRSLGLVSAVCMWAVVGCRESATLGVPPAATAAGSGAMPGAAGSGPSVPITKIDRSALANVGTDAPLDYADPRMWLCRPGNDPDQCDANLDATELRPDGTQQLVKHVKAENPAFDCFYVYPTVKLTSAGPMTDFSNIDITLDPLLSQGARFSRVCRMYAPLYRQLGVLPMASGAPTPGGSFELGLGDVRNAFKYYLEHLNNGRKVVVLGHSQGTGMLTAMLAQDVDPVPAVRAKLISALLIGGGVSVPVGAVVGGTFKNIPLCTQARQTGCVVSYVSYSAESPPMPMSTFGKAPAEGQMLGCTEPAALAGRPGMRYLGSYVRMNRVNKTFDPMGIDKLPPGISTPFVIYRDVLRGACKAPPGFSYLEISLEMAPGDMRPPPPYHFPTIEGTLGLHLMDYNLELDDLIEIVTLQAAAAGP